MLLNFLLKKGNQVIVNVSVSQSSAIGPWLFHVLHVQTKAPPQISTFIFSHLLNSFCWVLFST